ncbi:MAG: biopolymer transporter ExbD [Verrucomicrobiae bacterium]|nr:biopolymer transporter ExbD [Verrucomicrobiae bacterium]
MKFIERKRRQPTIIIVALIDVLCILLIFQMVTMTFRDTAAVQLTLPESKTAADSAAEQQGLVLTISRDEKLSLNEKEVAIDDLLTKLMVAKQKNPDVVLELRADEKVAFGFIIKVMDVAKEANIPAVSAFVRRSHN